MRWSSGALAFGLVATTATVALRAEDETPPQPEAKPVQRRNEKFMEGTLNEAQNAAVTVRTRDSSFRVADDLTPDVQKRIFRLVVTLQPNSDVIVDLRDGVLVGLEKGRLENPLLQLNAKVQGILKDTKEGDIVVVTSAKRVVTGKVDKVTAESIVFYPAQVAKAPVPGQKPAPMVFLKGVETVFFNALTNLENPTLEARQAAAAAAPGPNGVDPKLDLVAANKVAVGDTVHSGFYHGQVTEITDSELRLRLWSPTTGSWGDPVAVPRANIKQLDEDWLKLRRGTPANERGEVVVDEQRKRVGHTNSLYLKATVWHDQKEFVLAGATLVFVADKTGVDLDGATKEHEEVALPAIFYDERFTAEKRYDQDDGKVTVKFDPAKHLIPLVAPEAKPFIITLLARLMKGTDPIALGRVLAAAAKNGDPEVALVLAFRHAMAPKGPDGEKLQATIVEHLQTFGEKATQAILDHVTSPDGTYRIAEASEGGVVSWRDQKDQAASWKLLELKLLSKLPGAAIGERGRRLFNLSEERTDFSDGVLAIFGARPSEAIDALMEVAVSLTGRPTSEEIKRAEDASNLIKQMGDKAVDDLITRIRSQGKDGQILAKQLLALRNGSPPAPAQQIIDLALSRLVEWKKAERDASLKRMIDEARLKTALGKLDEAIALVEEVLKQDRDEDSAKALYHDLLMRVADQRIQEKKRGAAATILQQLLDDKVVGRGVEQRLGQLLLESAQEDLVANCVRAQPDPAAETVLKLSRGDVLKISQTNKRHVEGWIAVKLPKSDALGYVPVESVDLSGDGLSCSVNNTSLKPEAVRSRLERVRALAGVALGPQIDGIDGELWIRDAEARAEDEPKDALMSYERAKVLVPNDPRLSVMTKVWLRANSFVIMVAAGSTVGIAVLISLLFMRRQKRVTVTEFRYYGKDRAKAEREIDGGANDAAADLPTEPSAEPAPPPAA